MTETYRARALAMLAGPETAAEHIRNALQILANARPHRVNPSRRVLDGPDYAAFEARLRAALAQLETR